MIVAGLFGTVAKFTECTLGVKYRTGSPDGTVMGAPMCYITRGFTQRCVKRRIHGAAVQRGVTGAIIQGCRLPVVAVASLGPVTDVSDAMLFSMWIVNMIALLPDADH